MAHLVLVEEDGYRAAPPDLPDAAVVARARAAARCAAVEALASRLKRAALMAAEVPERDQDALGLMVP